MNKFNVRAFALDESHRNDLEELLLQLSSKKRVASIDNHPDTHCVGAFDGKRLVGFAQLFILHKTTFTMGHLEDVIVHEDYRRQGLGRRLMEIVIALAKAQGADVINLTTRQEREAAVALFSSLGFSSPANNVMRLSLHDAP